jgi:hypothetical protein
VLGLILPIPHSDKTPNALAVWFRKQFSATSVRMLFARTPECAIFDHSLNVLIETGNESAVLWECGMMITMRFVKHTIFFAIFIAVAAWSQTTGAGNYLKQATVLQEGGAIHINANSPRPLAQVLDALQIKFGWTVNYEDPQFTAAADIVDAPKGSPLAKLPAGAAFSVQFPANAPDEEKTLRLIVDSYNQSKNPGQFELRHTDRSFYVVGNAAHDDKGAMAKQSPLLDSPLTFASEERTITETVNLICEQLSAQGTTVTLAVTPRKPMDHNTVKLGGTKTPARDVLRQALQGTHQNLYWHLLYDPNSKGYFLDIHAAATQQ